MKTVVNYNQRDALVMKYLEVAERMASQKDKTTPTNISLDDLRSVAFLALLDAAGKYNGNPRTFKAYAMIRIRGDMIDYIRSMCWGTRGCYSGYVSLDAPVDENGACLADMVEDYRSPESDVEDNSQTDLGEKIFRLYHTQGYTMQEIGEQLGMHRLKVSRLLNKYKQGLSQERLVA